MAERRVFRRSDPDVRTRRRFARRQWARRWVTWKWAVSLLAAVSLVAGGVQLVWFSQVLGVTSVTVSGTGFLSADEIRAAAAVPRGRPLARVDLDLVESRVAALAPVRSVEAARVWPDSVAITVEERTPVAVVSIGGTVRGLDADGVVFRTYPRKPRSLPLVQADAEVRSEAIEEAAAVVSAMPSELAGRVDHIEVRTVDEISLVLRDGRTVVWGSADQSELKARVLGALLKEKGTRYDVSVPGQPRVAG